MSKWDSTPRVVEDDWAKILQDLDVEGQTGYWLIDNQPHIVVVNKQRKKVIV